MTTTQDLISRLRLGASISRDRKLNQGYEDVADKAADALEVLQSENAEQGRSIEALQAHLNDVQVEKDAALAQLAESFHATRILAERYRQRGDDCGYLARMLLSALNVFNP